MMFVFEYLKKGTISIIALSGNFLIWSNIIISIISFISYPVISEYYSPESYGFLGVFVAITSLAGIFGNSQYNFSISLSPNIVARVNSFYLSNTILFYISILFFVVCLVLTYLDVIFLSENNLTISLIAWISLLGSGINYNFSLLISSEKRYKLLAIGRLLFVIISITVQIVAFSLKEYGLLLAILLSAWITNLFYYWKMHKFLNEGALFLSKKKKFYLIKRYRRLVIYSLPSDLLNSVISNLPIFFIERFYSTAFLGLFNFSSKILSLPHSVFSSALGETFRQTARDEKNLSQHTQRSFLKYSFLLTFVNMIIYIPVIVFSDYIFETFFDAKWNGASDITKIIGWFFLLRGVVGPLSYVYHLYDRQKEDFITHLIFLFVLSIFLLICFTHNWDERSFLIGFCIFNVLLYLFYGLRSFLLSKP